MIDDQEYVNREPAPVGKLLAYWRSATAERIETNASLGLVRPGAEYDALLAELESISDYVERLLDQIDNGDLTDTESGRYQRIRAGEDDDEEGDDEDEVSAHSPIQQFVVNALQSGTGAIDIDDLVRGYYGHRLTESDRRHWRIRQAVARLAWPESYGLPGPAAVKVKLPSNRIFGEVRLTS